MAPDRTDLAGIKDRLGQLDELFDLILRKGARRFYNVVTHLGRLCVG
jgi:hypothetical protein